MRRFAIGLLLTHVRRRGLRRQVGPENRPRRMGAAPYSFSVASVIEGLTRSGGLLVLLGNFAAVRIWAARSLSELRL